MRAEWHEATTMNQSAFDSIASASQELNNNDSQAEAKVKEYVQDLRKFVISDGEADMGLRRKLRHE